MSSSAKVAWSEDQWIAACVHLIRCDSEDCRFCDRIKKQIQNENDDAVRAEGR